MSEQEEKKNVNWHRLGQGLVALVLVCCLLVNVSPIRAKAVGLGTLTLVSAATVIASVMIGLGVMMGPNSETFDRVVQSIQSNLAMKDFINEDGKCEVLKFTGNYGGDGDGGINTGAMNWFVSGALIQAVREYLFQKEVVSDATLPDGYAFYNGVALPVIEDVWVNKTQYKVGFIYLKPDSTYSLVFGSSFYEIKSDGIALISPAYSYDCVDGAWVLSGYNHNSGVAYKSLSLDVVWSSFDILNKNGSVYFPASLPLSSSISVSDGLTAGEIASLDQELSDGYSNWATNSQWDVDSSQWWPVGLGQTYDETKNYTQEQVQAGEGTYIVADSPVYNVNLPLAGSLTYERFTTAQPLTVSASVTDGGTIRYEWFRYQMEPSLGASESVGEGFSIVPDTSNIGKWTYYCKATNTVSNVSSLPITSNYVTVTIIDPNEQESPDISPTEAPGVDPDPGGDPNPNPGTDSDPSTDPDTEAEGNKDVNDLLEIIPDHSGEFGDVLKTLADSLSYEGTDAVLVIPQVALPALGDLVPGYVLMEEQRIDFAEYVEMMPEELLLLVRSLLTSALILYCFYEFYSMVGYVLALKKE